jgi:hypothetical protein
VWRLLVDVVSLTVSPTIWCDNDNCNYDDYENNDSINDDNSIKFLFIYVQT